MCLCHQQQHPATCKSLQTQTTSILCSDVCVGGEADRLRDTLSPTARAHPPTPIYDRITPLSALQPVNDHQDTCIRSRFGAKQIIRSGVALHQGTQISRLQRAANREPDPKCRLPLRRSSVEGPRAKGQSRARRGLNLLPTNNTLSCAANGRKVSSE